MDRGLVSDGAVSGRPAADISEPRSTTHRRLYRRLRGVDAARAIAVVGMVMVHIGPNPRPDTTLGNLYSISHGRASVLFVLLAGPWRVSERLVQLVRRWRRYRRASTRKLSI